MDEQLIATKAFAGAPAAFVQQTGEDLLARAGLTVDQHRDVAAKALRARDRASCRAGSCRHRPDCGAGSGSAVLAGKGSRRCPRSGLRS